MTCPKHIEEAASEISSTTEEQNAQYARELLSSAFMKRKLTELRSRSAKSATPSSQSNFLIGFMFGKKKNTMPEEVRMHCSAPSFSLRLGKVLSIWSKDEFKEEKESFSGKIVALYPGVNIFNDPTSWAKMLCDAYFVVILYSYDDKAVLDLKKAFERVIYSPLTKHLSGVAIAKTEEEGVNLLRSIKVESEREIVTLNNTEVE